MRIPDPIERGESHMEAWADENMRTGEYKCGGCGKWKPDIDCHQISPNPYSPPACWECCVDHWGFDPQAGGEHE